MKIIIIKHLTDRWLHSLATIAVAAAATAASRAVSVLHRRRKLTGPVIHERTFIRLRCRYKPVEQLDEFGIDLFPPVLCNRDSILSVSDKEAE